MWWLPTLLCTRNIISRAHMHTQSSAYYCRRLTQTQPKTYAPVTTIPVHSSHSQSHLWYSVLVLLGWDLVCPFCLSPSQKRSFTASFPCSGVFHWFTFSSSFTMDFRVASSTLFVLFSSAAMWIQSNISNHLLNVCRIDNRRPRNSSVTWFGGRTGSQKADPASLTTYADPGAISTNPPYRRVFFRSLLK